eukprot:jgi/Mesen1/7522/ME000039S06736
MTSSLSSDGFTWVTPNAGAAEQSQPQVVQGKRIPGKLVVGARLFSPVSPLSPSSSIDSPGTSLGSALPRSSSSLSRDSRMKGAPQTEQGRQEQAQGKGQVHEEGSLQEEIVPVEEQGGQGGGGDHPAIQRWLGAEEGEVVVGDAAAWEWEDTWRSRGSSHGDEYGAWPGSEFDSDEEEDDEEERGEEDRIGVVTADYAGGEARERRGESMLLDEREYYYHLRL